MTVDVLQIANWQRGGGKGSRPKPVRRPGDGHRKVGGSFTIEQLDAMKTDWPSEPEEEG